MHRDNFVCPCIYYLIFNIIFKLIWSFLQAFLRIVMKCIAAHTHSHTQNHTAMKEKALMQVITDITYEFRFRLISIKYKYSWRYYNPDLVWQILNIDLYISPHISPFPFPLQVVCYLLTNLLQSMRYVNGRKSDIKYKTYSSLAIVSKSQAHYEEHASIRCLRKNIGT